MLYSTCVYSIFCSLIVFISWCAIFVCFYSSFLCLISAPLCTQFTLKFRALTKILNKVVLQYQYPLFSYFYFITVSLCSKCSYLQVKLCDPCLSSLRRCIKELYKYSSFPFPFLLICRNRRFWCCIHVCYVPIKHLTYLFTCQSAKRNTKFMLVCIMVDVASRTRVANWII